MSQQQAEGVVPFVGTVGIFLIACNLASAFKISPPAKNIAFPVSLALVTIIYVIATGIRFVGIRGFRARGQYVSLLCAACDADCLCDEFVADEGKEARCAGEQTRESVQAQA